MSDFGVIKWIKKSRKQHDCVYCGRKIPIGIKYRRFVGMWQGDFQDWCSCEFCSINVEPTVDTDEGISYEDFYWWALNTHGKCSCGSTSVEYSWNELKTEIIFSCNKCDLKWVINIPFEIKEDTEGRK